MTQFGNISGLLLIHNQYLIQANVYSIIQVLLKKCKLVSGNDIYTVNLFVVFAWLWCLAYKGARLWHKRLGLSS